MDDNFDVEMSDFVKRMLEKYPDNEIYQKMLALLIQKKSEYDLEKLRFAKEIVINRENNYFNFCMQDAVLKQQWDLINNGFTAMAVPANDGYKISKLFNK
jgi:hypothetical protein